MLTAEVRDPASPADVLSLGEAEERLLVSSGVVNRAMAEVVATVAEMMGQGDAWLGWGYTSVNQWLRVRAGLSSARASAVVAAAERFQELPATMSLFGQGRITLEQVSVIVAHVPAEFEASVADMAPLATVDQLRRATKEYSFSEETPSEPAPAQEESTLSMRYTRGGRFSLRFEGSAEEGALIEKSVDEIKDALWRHLNGTEGSDESDASHSGVQRFGDVPRGEGGCQSVSRARAFVHAATASLAGLESASRRDAFRVYVHLGTDGGWLNGGARLPQHVLDALTCDGVLQPVWETEGKPVNVGRAHRIVPARTRRLIADRDRGCRYPGCGVRVGVEAHHIIHWADGGCSDTCNIVSLCSFHHDAHHRGEFQIVGDADAPEGHPDALVFTRHGYRIGYRAPDPAATLPAHAAAARATTDRAGRPVYSSPTGERLNTRWVTFTPRRC